MYWACAQLETHRERLALHTLGISGYQVYFPQIRTQRRLPSGPRRLITVPTALFPSYCFVEIELQWSQARWSPGVIRLVLDGERPAHVPPQVVEDLRQREDRDGYVVLPKARPMFVRGDKVRVISGAFDGHLAIFADMRPHERVSVLLMMLGSQRRVELPQTGIRPV